MKKTYYIPQTCVVTLNAQHMMAASNPEVTLKGDDSVEAGGVDTRRHHGVGAGLWEDMK